MSDDELKKIAPQGELELPRSRHNRFVDAARAHKSGKLRRQAGNRRGKTHANTAAAYNGSGEGVPRGGVVEIADTSNTEAQVEFVKPGDAAGGGRYAVAVEPIPADTIARIATSGGPWQIRVTSSVTPGQSVGPQDGSWDATTDGSEWDVVRGDVDGRAMVRSRGLQGLWEVTAVDSSAGTCTVQGVRWDGSNLETDSTREKTGVLYDPDNVPSEGNRGHLKSLSGGQAFFQPVGGGGRIVPLRYVAINPASGDQSFIYHLEEPLKLVNWNLAALSSGSITIDVWASSTFPPTDSNSITGGNEPSLSSAQSAEGDVSGWGTTSLSKGNSVMFNVDSVSGIDQAILQLRAI